MRTRFPLAAVLIATGCASVAPPPPNQVMAGPTQITEQLVERSYRLGVEQAVPVGGTIARVKDYRVERTQRQGAIHASEDFSLFYPILGPTVRITTAEPIRVVGTTVREGVTYRLVNLPRSPSGVKLLLKDDGQLEGSGLGLGDARMGYNYTPNPSSVRLKPDSSASANVTPVGGINFELIYSGATRDSIRLHYREYTYNDLARPAFSQDLTYERDSPTIRFRNMVIKVVSTTGGELRYVVVEDGYPQP